jgi:hypothetical protein
MSKVQGEAWEHMTSHAWSAAFGSVALLALLVLWMGSSDAWRRKLHLLYVLGMLWGFSALVFGAWHGGEMVYRHGVGVEAEEHAHVHEAGATTTAEHTDAKHGPAYYAPPLQVHVLLAGTAISLALAALGVSMRAGARHDDLVRTEGYGPAPALDQTGIASALNPSLSRPAYPGDVPDLNETPAAPVRRRLPAARWWLLATLIALGAAATGVWTLAHFSDIWDLGPTERVPHLVSLVTDRDLNGGSMLTRRMAHTASGVGIVVLMLVLALLARLTAGRRFMVLLFSSLLIVVVVAQVWFGSLLMFDTPSGPIGGLNGSEAALTSETTPPAPAPGTGETPTALPSTSPTATTRGTRATTSPAVPATAPAAAP